MQYQEDTRLNKSDEHNDTLLYMNDIGVRVGNSGFNERLRECTSAAANVPELRVGGCWTGSNKGFAMS